MDYAVSLARRMPEFKTPEDLAHVIRHTYVADEYKPERIQDIA